MDKIESKESYNSEADAQENQGVHLQNGIVFHQRLSRNRKYQFAKLNGTTWKNEQDVLKRDIITKTIVLHQRREAPTDVPNGSFADAWVNKAVIASTAFTGMFISATLM
nr:hypothetical protein [Tanacetum cinerariifolium]